MGKGARDTKKQQTQNKQRHKKQQTQNKLQTQRNNSIRLRLHMGETL